MHLEHAEHLRQTTDLVVLEVERRLTPDADLTTVEGDGRRDSCLAAHPMDEEAPMQRDGNRVALGRRRVDTGQLESNRRILVRFHRLVQVAVALLVSGRERAHRGFDPAANLGQSAAAQLPRHRARRSGEVAHGGSTVEAQRALAHQAVRDGPLGG